MDTKDWIQISTSLGLAATAFLAPYFIEKWKFDYRAPNLKITFKLSPPFCHQTSWRELGRDGEEVSPVYYFRFLVENTGGSKAEDCEVFLEEVYKQNSAGDYIKFSNFSQVNLKWSGLRDPYTRLIQPGRKMFCDIGRIHYPEYQYDSAYKSITHQEIKMNKFVFELPERYYSQWDCLIPGSYRIVVSIYSKNAKKVSRVFNLSWSGVWKDNENEMFEQLVIS